MKAKEIFEKIKKENLENEINLVKKINEGNENLKNTLQKIKKDMEKISIYSKVNYDFVPKKKKHRNRNDNNNIYFISTDLKEEIKSTEEPKSIFELDNNKINNEKEVIFLKKELMDNNNLNSNLKHDNTNLIDNSLNKNNSNKNLKRKRTNYTSNSFNKSQLTLNDSSLKKPNKNLNETNKKSNNNKNNNNNNNDISSNNKNYTLNNNDNRSNEENYHKLNNSKNIKLKTDYEKNKNKDLSPSILLKNRLSKNRNIKRNNITNSTTTLPSNSKKRNEISKNFENDFKKTIGSIDSNKKYYDIDSQNKIVSKYNTRRSDKNNLNYYIEIDNNENIHKGNKVKNNNNLFLKKNSLNNFHQNPRKYLKSDNITSNLNLINPEEHKIINSCSNYKGNNFDYYNDYNCNNYVNALEKKKKIKSISSENLLNKNYMNNNFIEEKNEENFNEISNLNDSNHKKFLSEDLNNINFKNNDSQKKFFELKNQIDLLKKEKDYIKKTINKTIENIQRKKIKKLNSDNNIINNNKTKQINISKNKYKRKKTIKEIYEDYKEKEEKVIKEMNKIKDYPEINPNDDKIAVFIDKLIKKSYKRYNNKECQNCYNLLSKGKSCEKCNIRKHTFKSYFY